ncbi:scamp-domain-containing protein [Histomonas meleagridis]|uniref:scamp-domain-containing protein n=1 Tax=Histomonas meleagridis TaxID=135588 RepID=UPI003559D5D8|nr:scamp-domain-containing protein [Histomonas meleagridis]KAH0803238.1 scamp-domain-containing protein [Histomonas meleagridis]
MDDIKNPFIDEEENHVAYPTEPIRQPPVNETPQEKLLRLQKREQELLKRQEELQQARIQTTNAPNWPKFFPIIYADIDHDIPERARKFVKVALYGIVFTGIQALINIIGAATISGLSTYSYPRNIIFSLIFTILELYLTASICFDRLYKGCKSHNIPISYTFLQFLLIGVIIYLFIGFPNSGSVGLATFLDLIAKSNSIWSKIISFINTLCLLCLGILHVYVFQQSQVYQRVSGLQETLVP